MRAGFRAGNRGQAASTACRNARLSSRRAGSFMFCCSSSIHRLVQAHREVELGVVAGRVGAELDQVACLLVARACSWRKRRAASRWSPAATLVITRETERSMSIAG